MCLQRPPISPTDQPIQSLQISIFHLLGVTVQANLRPALILSPPRIPQLVAISETYITKWGEKNHMMSQLLDNPSGRLIPLANLYWDAWSDDSCRPKEWSTVKLLVWIWLWLMSAGLMINTFSSKLFAGFMRSCVLSGVGCVCLGWTLVACSKNTKGLDLFDEVCDAGPATPANSDHHNPYTHEDVDHVDYCPASD